MSVSDELERLNALFMKGALSSEEYAQAKARVLGQGGAGTASQGTDDQSDSAAGGASAPDATFGARPAPGASQTPGHNGVLHRLSRSTTDRVLGGVCGGLGAHTGLPSWAWRLMFCVTAIYFGIGFLFYILMWIFIPQDSVTA
jgi:phage shock protein C